MAIVMKIRNNRVIYLNIHGKTRWVSSVSARLLICYHHCKRVHTLRHIYTCVASHVMSNLFNFDRSKYVVPCKTGGAFALQKCSL